METITLETTDRAALGSSNTRRLRRSGLIPAVLYGKKVENRNLAVDREAFEAVMRHHGRILDLKLPDGKVEKAILKEVQWDSFGDEVLHIDLGRVALDDKIRVKVDLKYHGDPKGVAAGGHLEVFMHETEIECLAGSIPDLLKIDVSGLELDHVMRVKDLKLPEGVKILAQDEAAVAAVKTIRIEELPVPGAPAEGAVAAGATEPEVITKGKKEEEGAEGEAGAAPGGKKEKEKEK